MRQGDGYSYHAEGVAAGRPLAFLFHGTGGTEMQFVPLARELMPGAGLVAPRGDVSEHGALRFFRRLGEGRYDMADLAERTEAMAHFVARMIDVAAKARESEHWAEVAPVCQALGSSGERVFDLLVRLGELTSHTNLAPYRAGISRHFAP